jgi:hypothetical protein
MSKSSYKEFNLDQNSGQHSISIKTSTIVKLNENFTVYTMEGPVDFNTQITCDFADIPDKYHETCINVLTSKYTNKVSFGRNPFSECKPLVKRKWYQFWKSKYFEANLK